MLCLADRCLDLAGTYVPADSDPLTLITHLQPMITCPVCKIAMSDEDFDVHDCPNRYLELVLAQEPKDDPE